MMRPATSAWRAIRDGLFLTIRAPGLLLAILLVTMTSAIPFAFAIEPEVMESLALQPPAVATGPVDEYEVLRVTVRGTRGGQAVEEISDCHVPGIPAWQLGVDVDTGCPPSIVAQMLVRGEIAVRGVLPPEKAVQPGPFFAALEKRGMKVTHS